MADGKPHKVEARVRELATLHDDKQIAEMVQVFCGAHTGPAGTNTARTDTSVRTCARSPQHTTPQARLTL